MKDKIERNEYGNIEEIAWDLCELYYKTKPPINKNGNVLYYMAGSLATLPFICADSMQEIMVDNGKIIRMGSIYDIPVEAKNNFSQFRRQINDTDYVYVSGEPSKAFIYNLYDIILDFDKISSKGKSVLHISDPRDCELGINLVKLTSNGKSIMVPNPIDIIGFKLLQTIGHIQAIQNTTQKLINDYANDDGTKSNLEEERVQLLKIIENLSLLKRQMDFLGYRDYSNLIIKQINQIKNILNDY